MGGGADTMFKRSSTRMGLRIVLGLVVVAAAAGVSSLRSTDGPSRVEVGTAAPVSAASEVAPALATAPDPRDLARTHATPKYLPAGAQSTGGRSLKGGWVEHFSLPGTVNSRTLPDTPDQYVRGSGAHPATGIDISQWPQDFSTFHGADPRLVQVTTISVMGVTATVVVPTSGYGTYRISWVRDGVAYDIQTQRLKAGDEGTSGVPITELVKIAQSIS